MNGQWTKSGAEGRHGEDLYYDVGTAVNADYHQKQYVLEPCGHDSRPVMCNPGCSGDTR